MAIGFLKTYMLALLTQGLAVRQNLALFYKSPMRIILCLISCVFLAFFLAMDKNYTSFLVITAPMKSILVGDRIS